MTRKHTNNRMQEKPNNFGLKYGNQKKKKNQRKSQVDKQYDKRIRRARRMRESGNTHLNLRQTSTATE